jgi:Protein of unknown function (DUF2778)
MIYTTGISTDVTCVQNFAPARRNLRLLWNSVGFGILAAALVVTSTAVTWMVLDSWDATGDTRAEVPAARAPIVMLADSRATLPVSEDTSPTPATFNSIDPGRSYHSIADDKTIPKAAAPSEELPVKAVKPEAVIFAALTPSTGPGVGTSPSAAALNSLAQLPLAASQPRIEALPLITATPRDAPPPVIAAPSNALSQPAAPSAPPPPVTAASSGATPPTTPPVPLPPKRPSGVLDSVPVSPPADTLHSSPLQASKDTANPQPLQANKETASPPSRETKQQVASTSSSVTNPPDNRSVLQRLFDALRQPASTSLPGSGVRTAVYDIAAHTVYMPNGERLEAHSGLGNRFDDPRYVSEKDRGPTPPHAYDLELRKDLFHGVAAVRLNPVGDGNMYGRVGMLAHTYMLGPRGDSNGCVSFREYQKFLRAFMNGEVSRLVVVTSVGAAPFSVASARN